MLCSLFLYLLNLLFKEKCVNTGVEILLKRIKDCPDDFQYDVSTDRSTKWNKLLMEALRSDVITDEEKTALRHEVTEMGRARFTENVMKALAGEDEPSDEGKILYGNTVSSNNWGATAIGALTSNSLTIGNTTLNESQLQKLLKLQVEEKFKVEVRKKATIR